MDSKSSSGTPDFADFFAKALEAGKQTGDYISPQDAKEKDGHLKMMAAIVNGMREAGSKATAHVQSLPKEARPLHLFQLAHRKCFPSHNPALARAKYPNGEQKRWTAIGTYTFAHVATDDGNMNLFNSDYRINSSGVLAMFSRMMLHVPGRVLLHPGTTMEDTKRLLAAVSAWKRIKQQKQEAQPTGPGASALVNPLFVEPLFAMLICLCVLAKWHSLAQSIGKDKTSEDVLDSQVDQWIKTLKEMADALGLNRGAIQALAAIFPTLGESMSDAFDDNPTFGDMFQKLADMLDDHESDK